MRLEIRGETPIHSLIIRALQEDRKALFAYFKQDRGTQALDEELVDVYELRPAELPTLTLPNNLSFVEGFSYVASHWYPLVRAVASGAVAPGEEHFMDSHLDRVFPDGRVTTQQLRDALLADPSGATWLEQMAQDEFREGNLELTGARKAITGAKRMYEQLIAVA
ncbi:hypothetical protein HYS91_00305 [Candidatus Daviesbacteria bacterium]|nr:hypothetical protein [Candidatus Daviesbacteria bacterium]